MLYSSVRNDLGRHPLHLAVGRAGSNSMLNVGIVFRTKGLLSLGTSLIPTGSIRDKPCPIPRLLFPQDPWRHSSSPFTYYVPNPVPTLCIVANQFPPSQLLLYGLGYCFGEQPVTVISVCNPGSTHFFLKPSRTSCMWLLSACSRAWSLTSVSSCLRRLVM